MPHLNGPTGRGLYPVTPWTIPDTSEAGAREGIFTWLCNSVPGKALPLPTPALCYLKHDTGEGRRRARERSQPIFTSTTSVVAKAVFFILLSSLLLLFIA